MDRHKEMRGEGGQRRGGDKERSEIVSGFETGSGETGVKVAKEKHRRLITFKL